MVKMYNVCNLIEWVFRHMLRGVEAKDIFFYFETFFIILNPKLDFIGEIIMQLVWPNYTTNKK